MINGNGGKEIEESHHSRFPTKRRIQEWERRDWRWNSECSFSLAGNFLCSKIQVDSRGRQHITWSAVVCGFPTSFTPSSAASNCLTWLHWNWNNNFYANQGSDPVGRKEYGGFLHERISLAVKPNLSSKLTGSFGCCYWNKWALTGVHLANQLTAYEELELREEEEE